MERQTLLLTATWPKAVRKLASTYLRDEQATTLFLGGGAVAGGEGGGEGGEAGGADDACELSANIAVSQSFVKATDDEKDAKLWNLLSEVHHYNTHTRAHSNEARSI